MPHVCPNHYLLKHVLRNWFKGADTTAVCRFLEDFFSRTLEDYIGPHRVYLEKILEALSGGNAFLSQLYRSHLFLSRAEARECSRNGFKLISSYLHVATIAHRLDLTRFKITPKLHICFHLVDRLYQASLEGSRTLCLNPVSFSCQLDEDLVGQVSTWSRAQSIRVVHERTIRAYLVNLRLQLIN